ncbi:MAG: kynureninase [Planctomycetota bacterium]|nr:kynureninase [Planctomycetota bacterium]
MPAASEAFGPLEEDARRLDAADPLRGYRERFHVPALPDGRSVAYFCGNSLGLQPKRARDLLVEELDEWRRRAVNGHFEGARPWFAYHEQFREPAARLIGALPSEVVTMNSLTVNLHLLMVSFYRPTRERFKILMEEPAFPSDTYAAQSQLRFHGFDLAAGLLRLRPREGEAALRTEDILARIETEGASIALVLLGGVNFVTGQWFDMPRITEAARRAGCTVGWDLAHAAGNVPLRLHDWGADFAAWCSYKYLNAGPGAVAGCFVHERHARSPDLVRFAGWWGNDPATRFRMQLNETFVPREGADGWQISNPPIFALAPLLASLELFDAAGMDALRAKSLRLTGYLEFLLDRLPAGFIEVATPRDPARRGCQLSIRVPGRAKALRARLEAAGVVCDFREPDTLRVAPAPLYNSFHDVWRFARELADEGAHA